MTAKLVPLRFRPGLNRNLTRHGGEGGWFDCDKVRFRDGQPEVIGGWTRFANAQFLGACRAIYPWTTLANEVLFGVGTSIKYYILRGGSLIDVTPLRLTTATGAVTFSAVDGSTTLTVAHTSHGAVLGDYVTFSGAVTLGGVVTGTVLNAEYSVTHVVDANSYEVELAVAANASDTGDGGASVVGRYQINIGLDTSTFGTGWGTDPWGSGGWGEAGTQAALSGTLRVWSHDNFGEDLVLNPRDGNVYYWDSSAGFSSANRATPLSSLAGAVAAPTVAKMVMVSNQDRHVVCFGCDDQFTPGLQDPLLIRWSDQEDAANWQTASTTTTAGSIRLSAGSEIITATQTRREILVFTDASLHSMQFLGPPYTFGIQDLSNSVTIVGPEAAVSANGVVYWMSPGKFMVYDGMIRTIPCDVDDYVFGDLNYDQRQKVCTLHNLEFSEVWWFYPSAASETNDRYVAYNYDEDLWFFGTMARTAWAATGVITKPIGASTDGYIYEHEDSYNDGSVSPSGAISAYIESSALDIADGDRFFFSRRAIPDITFRQSVGSPTVTMTFKSFRFPGANIYATESPQVMQTATVPVEQYTEQVYLRLRGRAFSVRVESSQENTSWRLGVPRIELRTDGAR